MCKLGDIEIQCSLSIGSRFTDNRFMARQASKADLCFGASLLSSQRFTIKCIKAAQNCSE